MMTCGLNLTTSTITIDSSPFFSKSRLGKKGVVSFFRPLTVQVCKCLNSITYFCICFIRIYSDKVVVVHQEVQHIGDLRAFSDPSQAHASPEHKKNNQFCLQYRLLWRVDLSKHV